MWSAPPVRSTGHAHARNRRRAAPQCSPVSACDGELETDRNGTVAVAKCGTTAEWWPVREEVVVIVVPLVELGVTSGVTRLKMLAAFIIDGGNSTNCLVNRPGGQPGTSVSSATLEKSRSLNDEVIPVLGRVVDAIPACDRCRWSSTFPVPATAVREPVGRPPGCRTAGGSLLGVSIGGSGGWRS